MIDWSQAPDFRRDRWPEGELEFLEPYVLYRLQKGVRTPFGRPMIISPVEGAVARFGGNPDNRHYAVGRLSDAIDVFVPHEPLEAWRHAVREFSVGIYYDTEYNHQPTIMLHVDTRPTPLWWCRVDGVYYYPSHGGAAQKLFYARLHDLT